MIVSTTASGSVDDGSGQPFLPLKISTCHEAVRSSMQTQHQSNKEITISEIAISKLPGTYSRSRHSSVLSDDIPADSLLDA